MEVTVLNRQRDHRVGRHGLVEFVRKASAALPAAPATDSVAIVLVSDSRIRELNRRYRGKDSATDVLSFPAGAEGDPLGERHLGDIVISVATAARQSRPTQRALIRELKMLALHGYLHLLGYDHEADDGAMTRLERRLLRRLLPPGKGVS